MKRKDMLFFCDTVSRIKLYMKFRYIIFLFMKKIFICQEYFKSTQKDIFLHIDINYTNEQKRKKIYICHLIKKITSILRANK